MLKKFTVALCLALAACQSDSTASFTLTVSPQASTPEQVATEAAGRGSEYSLLQPNDVETSAYAEPIHITMQGMDIELTPPQGWQVYESENTLVLAERMGSIDSGATLEGVQIHFFVPVLDDLDLPMSDDTNVAYYILDQISKKSPNAARGTMTEPEAFIWKSCYAAYFLVSGSSIYTLVLAVIPTGTNQLLAISISAPNSRATDIRPTLMKLVQSLSVNGIYLDSASLRILPNPLVFPTEEAPVSASFVEQP